MKHITIIVSSIVVAALSLSLIGCARSSEGRSANRQERNRNQNRQQVQNNPAAGESVVLSENEIEAVGLNTAVAVRTPVRHRLAAMGKVLADPKLMAIVSYAFPARIAESHVSIGDWIAVGQPLVTLQSEEVGVAKAEFYEAQAGLELAQANHERARLLHQRGVGAQKDLLAGEAELKVAQAQLESAEKKLHLLGFTEKQVQEINETHQVNPEITLFAPISGKAARVDAVRGSMVDQGHEIVLILDPSRLVVDAEVYERDIALVGVDQRVEIEVPAFPSERFGGRISYVGDILDASTRTITVRTKVANTDGKLKPGMFADVSIELNREAEAVVVPACAVIHDNDNHRVVFVVENGAYEARVVEVGLEEDGLVEIVAGVAAGEEVVTQGAYQLKAKLRAGQLSHGH